MDSTEIEISKVAANTKLKRSHWHDYRSPSIYLFTVTVVNREPLLGNVVGDIEHASIKLTPVGMAVKREIYVIPQLHPQVQILQYQIMPDHVHLVLRVKERLPEQMPIGNIVAAWKYACGKAYSTLLLRDLKASSHNGQENMQSRPSSETTFRSPEKAPYHPLFSKGYNDSAITSKGQLNHMIAYVQDNPRRLLIKRQRHHLFQLNRSLSIAGMTFDAVGNTSLLQRPLVAVHCHRHWTTAEQETYSRGLPIQISEWSSPCRCIHIQNRKNYRTCCIGSWAAAHPFGRKRLQRIVQTHRTRFLRLCRRTAASPCPMAIPQQQLSYHPRAMQAIKHNGRKDGHNS